MKKKLQRILVYLILISACASLSLAIIEVYSGDSSPNVEENISEVEFLNDRGGVAQSVEAEVSTTPSEKYEGLSNKENLDVGKGMIFIFKEQTERSFVMRDMDFGIDIIFVGSDCTVTETYSASEPKSNETGVEDKHTYTGTGQYVIEVNKGFTEEYNIEPSDEVRFGYDSNTSLGC